MKKNTDIGSITQRLYKAQCLGFIGWDAELREQLLIPAHQYHTPIREHKGTTRVCSDCNDYYQKDKPYKQPLVLSAGQDGTAQYNG